MNTNLIPLLLIIFLAGIGVLGDYFIKLSGNGPRYIAYQPFFIGMIIYASTAVGWFYVMKHVKLGVLGIFYSVTTAILLVAVGIFFFKEQATIYDIVGIALGIASLIILGGFG